LALCAGVGGLERGIESIIPQSRTVCYVEGETYPASVLASKMEAGSLPKALIWSNVRTFDGKAWRGKVSILSGGFPCQPYSKAGKQLADKDPRDLWPDFARIIGEVRPKFIFLENVANVVKWALPTVLEDLSEMGYDAAWCVVAASDVGAPHKRSRWFLFAHSNDASEYVMRFNEPQSSTQEFEGIDEKQLAHTNSQSYSKPQRTGGELRQKGSRLEGGKDQGETGDFIRGRSKKEELCHPNSNRRGEYANEKSRQRIIEGGELEGDRPKDISHIDTKIKHIPNSNSIGRRQNHGEGKSKFINQNGKEKRIKSNFWEVEPSVGRVVDGVADWVHRMRACGNGVVPQQAAYAYSILMERCGFMVSKS